MNKWDYGGAWRNHDMTGEIHLAQGVVKVQDIVKGMPDFMRQADMLFIDPPCSQGNLKSFYTKADQSLPFGYDEFDLALWRCIDNIQPRQLFVETFKSNHTRILAAMQQRYPSVLVYDSHYYNRANNRCWIVHGFTGTPQHLPISGMDEAKVIEWLCHNVDAECVGDLCMGRGLVGWHAYQAGRRFVGTELNPKRLAVLVDRIRTAEAKPHAQR